MIKAVLFDMDGVLIDTEKYLNQFWKQAANEAGLPLTKEDCYMFRSFASKFAAVAFREKYGEAYDFYAIRARRVELMKAHIAANGIELKPRVKETLQELKKRGYQVAVVTATDLERTTEYLTSLGIFDWFDSIICAPMVARGKPYPDVYEYACEQIGRKPEECVAVEDSPNGVKAASSAGVRTIMVPDLTEPEEELLPRIYGVAKDLYHVLDYLE